MIGINHLGIEIFVSDIVMYEKKEARVTYGHAGFLDRVLSVWHADVDMFDI